VLSRPSRSARRARCTKAWEKLDATPKKDKRKYLRARWKAMRARIMVSRCIREIEFTEPVKRRLIEDIKEAVERMGGVVREAEASTAS